MLARSLALTLAATQAAAPRGAHNTLQSDRPSPVLPLQWIHIPKTASTFADTVYRHACHDIPRKASYHSTGKTGNFPISGLTKCYPPEEYCQGGWVEPDRLNGHKPVVTDHSGMPIAKLRGRLVTLMREPQSLKESFLEFVGQAGGPKFIGSMLPDDSPAAEAETLSELTAAHLSAKSGSPDRCNFLRAFLPRLQGAASKMALGIDYLQLPANNVTAQALLRRLERLLEGGGEGDNSSSFFFVGTTERFNESVCLFHALASTDMQFRNGALPVPNQFTNSRKTKNETGLDWRDETRLCNLPEELLTEDSLDSAFFSYANVRLNRSLEAITATGGAQHVVYQTCMAKVAALQKEGSGKWAMRDGAWLMDAA